MTQKLFHRVTQKIGMTPGALVHVGDDPTGPVRISVIDYDNDTLREHDASSVDEVLRYKTSTSVTWINVDGVHQADTIQEFGDKFGLHPLLLEDVMHTEQRPKVELFDDCVYVVLRMLYNATLEKGELEVASEQISMVIGPTWVLTFQEEPGDIFDPVRDRIRQSRGRIRKMGADYLAYALMDIVVDQYFSVLEAFGDHLENLEEDLMGPPQQDTLYEVRHVKRAMMEVRRVVWPVRDLLNVLLRGESPLFKKATLVYLRDVYDHTIRVADMVETLRELIAGLIDLYMSNVSNRMNEIMKVLTIMATIFIPLTFIAGVYGMNFEHMPELHWEYGYWYAWGIMVAVGAILFIYFRKKHWL